MALQIRRGTEAQRAVLTGVAGELLYTTDTKKLYVGDGVTAGGTEVGGAEAIDLTAPGAIGSVTASTGAFTTIGATTPGTGDFTTIGATTPGTGDFTTIGATTPGTGAFTSVDIGSTIAITGVLDEDTMSSDSAVKLATQQSIKAYVDTAIAVPSAPSAGQVIQVLQSNTGAFFTTTTIIPKDDTIPQNNEGVEITTLAITPSKSGNKILIIANGILCNSNSGSTFHTAAIFLDSTASALASSTAMGGSNYVDAVTNSVIHHLYTTVSGAVHTFKLRCGTNVGTTKVNGVNAGRLYGGSLTSGITLMEIEA